MITIYHLGVSQSDRVVWLMEELGLPYKLEWFDRGADGLAPQEYRDLHPVGTAPIIKDGDVILSESAAIVEYISQRYGNGMLSIAIDDAEYPEYLYWMQFNNNVQSAFFIKKALEAEAQSAQIKPINRVMQRREDAYFSYLNQRLGMVPYLAGENFSCADIMTVFNLTTLPLFGGRSIDDLPNVKTYLERISQRPAYIKAMAIAGPQAAKPV
jgi:glutathione S-transferase